jgi:uncharacterized protein
MRPALLLALVLAAAGAAAVPSARGQNLMPASFDCRKARGWVEKAICADPELSDKDGRMALAFDDLVAQAREGGGEDFDMRMFRDEQRQWLSERNACRTKACLHAAYDKRIDEVTVDY